MARYSGGPVTHRALTGPRASTGSENYEGEILYTLKCMREIRTRIADNELRTVRMAREVGLSWTEIATALGRTREDVESRWTELDARTDVSS